MAQRIAVINDDTVFLGLLHDLLTEEGYEVHLIKEANSAYQTARDLAPDAIVLDIRMENPASGWQLLELLKLDPTLANTPVIVCSADLAALQERSTHLQRKGCQVLAKPFDLDDLLTMLRQVLKTAPDE